MKRRDFCKTGLLGLPLLASCRFPGEEDAAEIDPQVSVPLSSLFWVKNIPGQPFVSPTSRNHLGMDALVALLGEHGLMFYQSPSTGPFQGPGGLIASDDVVLIKVNAQWKYRGCTNSDLITGLIETILQHPDGFVGEVVIFENGQGRGSLNCNTDVKYEDDTVHANAENESHSFRYVVEEIFNDPRVGIRLLDPIRRNFIGPEEHIQEGYRLLENVSYPCFNTLGGQRVELKEGVWTGSEYRQNLKLINVPVLKHHGGSEITASLKHTYGILSMGDGQIKTRHYSGLGETCGKMFVSVRQPVLNIIDAIWVSHASLEGYPARTTTRKNQILAGFDPVALDYWAAKHILHPIDYDERHHPDFERVQKWLVGAQDLINERGGLYNYSRGQYETVTLVEDEMQVFTHES